MNPILSVEFKVQAADGVFSEESVAIRDPEELFEFVAPGGGCEQIPDPEGCLPEDICHGSTQKYTEEKFPTL